MTSTEELAWMAGFFDGEGSVIIGKGHSLPKGLRTVSYLLQVVVTNTHGPSIERIQKLFSGNATLNTRRRHKHHKPTYRWCLYGTAAAQFLDSILPYLVTKREQALIGLTFQKRIENAKHIRRGDGQWKQLSKAELEAREQLFQQLRQLNRRGAFTPLQSKPTILMRHGNVPQWEEEFLLELESKTQIIRQLRLPSNSETNLEGR